MPVDIVTICTFMVLPVLEYACPVWHTGLTVLQSDQLEVIQRRALGIAHPDIPHREPLQETRLETMECGRVML